MNPKHVIAYFPNWGTHNIKYQNFNAGMIPWNKVSIIQHAFFSIGNNWQLTSTDSWSDFDKPYEHSQLGNHELKGHFGEYRYYKSLYPDKKILISIGGPTRSYKFSQLACNKEKRSVFIKSCIDFLKKYPFIDGINIDWQYPHKKDKTNFTILLKEIRESFNFNNMADKWLTITAPADYENIAHQDIKNYKIYIDLVNIMTYDYYGPWDNITNHHAPLHFNPLNTDINSKYYNIVSSVKEFLDNGLPKEKLCIASQLYSRGWKNLDIPPATTDPIYTKVKENIENSWDESYSNSTQFPWYEIKNFESNESWEKFYDDVSKSPYLFNKNENLFLTYEDEASLIEKCNYIISKDLAGLIICEITGDDLLNNAPMTTAAWKILVEDQEKNYLTDLPPKSAKCIAYDSISLDGTYSLKFSIEANNNATEYELLENDIIIKSETLNDNLSKEQIISHKAIGNSPGFYLYKLILKNKNYLTPSETIVVNVEKIIEPISKPSVPVLLIDSPSNTGSYTISILNPPKNNATHLRLFENNILLGQTTVENSHTQETYQIVFENKEPGIYVYKAELSNNYGTTSSEPITIIVSSLTSPEASNSPTIPTLSHNNWEQKNNYTIISNMWWGTNATKLSLYENNNLISSRDLKDNTPNAQTQRWCFNNKPNGTYYYHIIAENINGKVQSKTLPINVIKSKNGIIPTIKTPVISVDNENNTGSYNLTLHFSPNNSATEFKLYENNLVIHSGLLTPNKDYEETIDIAYNNKNNGKYEYKLVLNNDKTTINSDIVTITVNNDSDLPDDYSTATLTFAISTDWGSGANFNITIYNNDTISLNNWSLEFDFDKIITNVWDATMSSTENHYEFSNISNGVSILPGSSFTFHGTCMGNVGTLKPRNTIFNGKFIPIQ